MVVVQVVEIRWTKATRGAPRANERAALPRAFVLSGMQGNYVVQRYRLDEAAGFRPELLKEASSPVVPRLERSLALKLRDDAHLALGLVWDSIEGQPRRHPQREAVHLAPGESARLVINGRHTYTSTSYTEVVYNVAYGETVASNRFLAGPPDHVFSLAADLF